MKIFKEVFQLGEHKVSIETGRIARQATASVMVTMGDTVVSVSCVANSEAKEGASFFPLTVNYMEKAYAGGKIPGGFPKREGKPQDHETLVARLIDRPIRPLFPEQFYHEVQIVATVMSYDPEVPADIPAMIGASAVLSLSGLPFAGPIGALRIGFKDGEYLLNPSTEKLSSSELDLIVAGTKNAVLMVESEAQCLPEEVMLGAILYGHEQMQVIINAIEQLKRHAGNTAWTWQTLKTDQVLKDQIKSRFNADIANAYALSDKKARNEKLAKLRHHITETFLADESDEKDYEIADIEAVIYELEKEYVRKRILSGKSRIDGRDTRSIRPISVNTGFLPRTHGSAVFTRGETQAIVVTTLGDDKNAQFIDSIAGDRRERFLLHYNFPPYAVGECGFMGMPKRREIGHGNLANRALRYVLPDASEYPYVIRVVSEITESNGSSSMASVCGGSLSMMDAGVPLKAPVAGIAMGLIKHGDKYAVLSDIIGDEDHLGDMDFKVAGTYDGITALQMDIKIAGITRDIMKAALDQAKEGRQHILNIMNEDLDKARTELSAHAPQTETLQIDPGKVKEIIGKGGSTIKSLTKDTGADINVEESGEIRIFAKSKESLDQARNAIEALTADVITGQSYEGTVVKVMDFGAFVNLMPGKDGLLHISEMGENEDANRIFAKGQKIHVKVTNVDANGKIKLVPTDS